MQQVQLNKANIHSCKHNSDELVIFFKPLYLIKSLAGAQDTFWQQDAELSLYNAKITGSLPDKAAIIITATLELPPYTYIDQTPLPLEQNGYTELTLQLSGMEQEINIIAHGVKLQLLDSDRYLKHL